MGGKNYVKGGGGWSLVAKESGMGYGKWGGEMGERRKWTGWY